MKIADVRTGVVGNPWKNWIFVVVETDGDALLNLLKSISAPSFRNWRSSLIEMPPD